ncbi:NAD-dependent epimerase/dehydratase family protein [Chitinophaga sp. 30R24]|uniref:NAD-dependent epimerase/dehydratase family protein n=1 Tax=Chitinophaga sp. 30R24 TaxID=3248838 RepID=UPI003B8FF896
MKILIIGSQGFIGQNLYNFFSKKHIVNAADVFYHLEQEHFSLLRKVDTDYFDLFKNVNYDLCINASGNGSVPVSLEDPMLDFELNVRNTFKILESIKKYNPDCKFINLSSAAIYGNPERLPINESNSVKPLSPYGWHKKMTEDLCREYFCLYNVRSVSLRLFSVYGEGLRKQLFWDLFNKIKHSSNIELFGTGSETRDFIYIQDVLHAIQCIIDNCDFSANVINVASGEETSISTAAQIFCQAISSNVNIIFTNKVKAGDPLKWKADTSLLEGMGFVRRTSINDGLKNTAKWLLENV